MNDILIIIAGVIIIGAVFALGIILTIPLQGL